MTYDFRPAQRNKTQLLIGTAGATGSGKTFSLLVLGTGLAYPEATTADELNAIIASEGKSRIAFVDTERGRALHYAPPPGEKPDPWRAHGAWFSFDHMNLEPPFTPDNYQGAIETADAAGYRVIIVDSFSHEWVGEGGILEQQEADMQASAERRAARYNRAVSFQDLEAVKMQSWIKPKMAHKKLVGRLTALHAHLLVGLRAEEKVLMKKDPNDPKKTIVVSPADRPVKERWTPVCEKAFPFELTLSFVLTPTDPGVPVPVKLQEQHRPMVALDKPISFETGRALAAWAGGGKVTAEKTRTKITPEEFVRTYKDGLSECSDLDSLAEYQASASKALDKLKREHPSLHAECVEANSARFNDLSEGTD